MIHHILLFSALVVADATPQAKMVVPKSGPAVVEIIGLKATPADLAKSCKLVVGEGTPAEIAKRQSVAGTWSVSEKAIRFEPQFPLVPGVKYRITIDGIALDLLIPKPPPGPPTSIAAVYPSANRLPENTLRFYVHFSGQMTRGNIYRHLKLIRDDGKEVLRPFLELDEELWSADGLRVTILFHPGRVKRELVPREEEGPILEEGHRYTLIVSREWKDAEGRPLVADLKKTFIAGPPDEEPIDPLTWSLMAPRGSSDSPVILRLAKPLDRALLSSTITIIDAKGNPVEGEITVGGGERVVTFAPAKPWKNGEYRLVVANYLEDVCGNRVGEPFEVDTTKPAPKKNETRTFERPFAVR